MNGMARRVGFELSDPRQAATSSRASRSIGLVACGRSQEVAALAMEPLQTRLRKATRKAHRWACGEASGRSRHVHACKRPPALAHAACRTRW